MESLQAGIETEIFDQPPEPHIEVMEQAAQQCAAMFLTASLAWAAEARWIRRRRQVALAVAKGETMSS